MNATFVPLPKPSATAAMEPPSPPDRECRLSRRTSSPADLVTGSEVEAVEGPIRETLLVAPTAATMDRAWRKGARIPSGTPARDRYRSAKHRRPAPRTGDGPPMSE